MPWARGRAPRSCRSPPDRCDRPTSVGVGAPDATSDHVICADHSTTSSRVRRRTPRSNARCDPAMPVRGGLCCRWRRPGPMGQPRRSAHSGGELCGGDRERRDARQGVPAELDPEDRQRPPPPGALDDVTAQLAVLGPPDLVHGVRLPGRPGGCPLGFAGTGGARRRQPSTVSPRPDRTDRPVTVRPPDRLPRTAGPPGAPRTTPTWRPRPAARARRPSGRPAR